MGSSLSLALAEFDWFGDPAPRVVTARDICSPAAKSTIFKDEDAECEFPGKRTS